MFVATESASAEPYALIPLYAYHRIGGIWINPRFDGLIGLMFYFACAC